MRRKDTEIVTHMPVKRDVEGAAEISQRILNYYRKMKNPVMTSTKWQKRLIAKVRSGKKRRGRLNKGVHPDAANAAAAARATRMS